MAPAEPPTPLQPSDFTVETLGPATIPNPISVNAPDGDPVYHYIHDQTRIRYDVQMPAASEETAAASFEKAGIREHIYFEPANVHAAIVTCGGLSPGLNDVIRVVVNELYYRYGVSRISGVRYGYRGLNPEYGHALLPLVPDEVADIQADAGTILGSSRGLQALDVMAETLEREGISMLFCIGGDGTQRAAGELHAACARRGYKASIIGIPKTIDNDIAFVYKTFGFDTAVSFATQAINGAHTEARAYPRGVGIVKLMGRDSGFIAAHAALASGHANFLLVPEVSFRLDGENGLLQLLARRLTKRDHAVIVVAEGAGQELFAEANAERPGQTHNVQYHDIGIHLRDRIAEHFATTGEPVSMKYIDPSYMVRNTPANAHDSLFCADLGRAAVHAAMAGKSNAMVGLWHNVLVHVPIPLAVRHRKRIKPESALWFSVLESTGQPAHMH